MKQFVIAVILFQVCGNDLIIIQDGQPSIACNTVTQACKNIGVTQLLLARQTSTCTKLQEFKIVE